MWPSNTESEKRTVLPPCRVCGDKAAGFHYGVNTCEACKGFFHRSLRKHTEYKCRANRTSGFCEYKPGKRKSCQFCRYQRCLQAGMSKDAIKTGRYTYLKRTEDTNEIKRLETVTSGQQKAKVTPSEESSPERSKKGKINPKIAFSGSLVDPFGTKTAQTLNLDKLDKTLHTSGSNSSIVEALVRDQTHHENTNKKLEHHSCHSASQQLSRASEEIPVPSKNQKNQTRALDSSGAHVQSHLADGSSLNSDQEFNSSLMRQLLLSKGKKQSQASVDSHGMTMSASTQSMSVNEDSMMMSPPMPRSVSGSFHQVEGTHTIPHPSPISSQGGIVPDPHDTASNTYPPRFDSNFQDINSNQCPPSGYLGNSLFSPHDLLQSPLTPKVAENQADVEMFSDMFFPIDKQAESGKSMSSILQMYPPSTWVEPEDFHTSPETVIFQSNNDISDLDNEVNSYNQGGLSTMETDASGTFGGDLEFNDNVGFDYDPGIPIKNSCGRSTTAYHGDKTLYRGKLHSALNRGKPDSALNRDKLESAMIRGKLEAAANRGKVETAMNRGKLGATVNRGKMDSFSAFHTATNSPYDTALPNNMSRGKTRCETDSDSYSQHTGSVVTTSAHNDRRPNAKQMYSSFTADPYGEPAHESLGGSYGQQNAESDHLQNCNIGSNESSSPKSPTDNGASTSGYVSDHSLRKSFRPSQLTPCQTLLTTDRPPSRSDQLRSVSPLNRHRTDSDQDEHPPQSPLPPPLRPFSGPLANITPQNVHTLYADMDDVISALINSHANYIGDFSKFPKDELYKQQKAHKEACEIKAKTFGNLKPLNEKEYDEIYSMTGIDVDNRRKVIQIYLNRMERCVKGLVQFAKSIPGFSSLDIKTQVDLIKLARSEFAVFTTYPTTNLKLEVALGLAGRWICKHELGQLAKHNAVIEYLRFCDKLQKLNPSREEVVLLKAMLVVSTDRDETVSSELADAIHWQLCRTLQYAISKRHKNIGTVLARYVLLLTQSRAVWEYFKDVLRIMKMDKYSTIEQNPLMWEMYSWIIHGH